MIDVIATKVASPLSAYALDEAIRSDLGDLAFQAASSTTIVVPLTSLALTALGAYGNPATLLLHGRYRSAGGLDWQHLLFGRTNPFRRFLMLTLVLFFASALLRVGRDFDLSDTHAPTVLLIAAVSVGNLAAFLLFVYWALRLRRGAEMSQHLRDRAVNVIAYVSTRGRLHRSGQSSLATAFSCEYEEQETLKQYLLELQQLALRALAESQPDVASTALSALHEVQVSSVALRGAFPEEWWKIRDEGPGGRQRYWTDLLAIDTVGEVLLASAERHHYFLGDECSRILEEIFLATRGNRASLAERDLVFSILVQLWNAVDECVQFGEFHTGRRVIAALRSVTLDMATDPVLADMLATHMPQIAEQTSELAIARDDVGTVRATLALLTELCAEVPTARPNLFAACTRLAGLALAGRTYATASVLIDWLVALVGAPTYAASAVDVLSGRHSWPVTEHERIAFALTAARARQFHSAWPDDVIRVAAQGVALVDGQFGRCARVAERLASVVSYPETEKRDFLTGLTAVSLFA